MSRPTSQTRRVLERLLKRPDGNLAWRRLVAMGVLLGAYMLLQPWIVRTTGIALPGFADLGEMAGVTAPDAPTPPVKGKPQRPGQKTPKAEPRRDLPPAQQSDSSPSDQGASANGAFLRDVGGEVFESPAGLRYTRGSAHGHRVKHVMAHARDAPNRRGQHGVFDANDQATVFALLDEVYEQALDRKRTQTKTEGRRTVHTVDLNRRIGYIGGESGGRRNHPPARHVRMVLQGKNVITAFPMTP